MNSLPNNRNAKSPLTGRYARLFLAAGAAGLLPVLLLAVFLPEALLPGILAYLLSFLFVGSNLLVIRKTGTWSDDLFYPIFLVSLAIRFLLVIAVLLFMLKVVKIHHIYFTVNFIIAYLFHSVIEIIFLHRTLETETE